jgi:Zn-dependent protease with chaperone function
VHDDLQRAGRRRLVLTAIAGVTLLTVSLGLLVFPIVWATVFAFDAVAGDALGWDVVLRAALISVGLGVATAVITTTVTWRHAERDALHSADLQLASVPGSRIEVVPSFRVAGEALPRVRTLLDTLSLAAGVLPPRCAIVVDPAPNVMSVGRRADTAWVVCTTGLLDTLTRRELEAVMAYELGRVACQEVSLDTVVYACTGRSFEVWASVLDWDEVSLLLAPITALSLPLFVGCALVRRSALSAQARLSDGLAVQFCRDPSALVSALRRIEADDRTVRFAGAPNAHLWLDYPHTRASRWLLGTRRLLGARIRRLERMTGATPPAVRREA